MENDKPFEPSKKKLKKAKIKGQVPKAKEITAFAQLSVCFLSIYFFQSSCHSLVDLYHKILKNSDKFSLEADSRIWFTFLEMFGIVVGGVGILLCIMTVLSEVGQVGFNFNGEKLRFKLSNLNVIQGLLKIVGAKDGKVAPVGLFLEIVQLLVLGVFIFFGLWFFVWSYTLRILNAEYIGMLELGLKLGMLVLRFTYYILSVAFLYAVLKYYESKRTIRKQLMMSFNELKQEMKDDEGDPHIKNERKAIHHEVVMHGMIENVKKAKVVVSDI